MNTKQKDYGIFIGTLIVIVVLGLLTYLALAKDRDLEEKRNETWMKWEQDRADYIEEQDNLDEWNSESKADEHICSLSSVVCEDEEDIIEPVQTQETTVLSDLGPIEEVIVEKCKQAGLADWEINKFMDIAWCESRYDNNAQNKYSSAAGVMQIIKGTWQESSDYSWEDRYNAEKNIETAIKVYNRYGFGAWVCS